MIHCSNNIFRCGTGLIRDIFTRASYLVWSYILYSPITLPVSFNKDLTVIYSTLLVWKISQAEKIWGRLYVSFLYYVLLLLLKDCIFQMGNTSEILIIILEKNMIIPNLTNSGISWSICIHPTESRKNCSPQCSQDTLKRLSSNKPNLH